MGTANFHVTKYGPSRGTGSGTTYSSAYRLSGSYTTSTTASNLEDASGDVSLASGDVLAITPDEDMRVSFQSTATATNGILCPAFATTDIEIHKDDAGPVSIVDVA